MSIINITHPKPFMGRRVEIEVKFDFPGDWKALRAAESWCNDRGMGTGSGDYPNPIAITNGPYDYTQKWHNFTDEQKKNVFGVITGDMRDGPMTIRIYQ